MKSGVGFSLGLVSGAVAAAALLYVNPLTQGAGSRDEHAGRSYAYIYPEDSSLALTHNGFGVLPLLPDGVPRLWESTIRATSLNVLQLAAGEDGVGAAATRISVPSPDTDPLKRGAIVSDYWLVSEPGRGSFFVHSDNNVWPLIKQALLPVVLLEREFAGPATFSPTVGPSRGGLGAVYGATGEYAGLKGRAAERYRLERLSGDGRIERLAGELSVRFDPAETVGD